MTKSVKITIAVLLLLCVIIAVFPLMSIKDSEFGGADGAAEEAISEIDPGYEPWAESILEPPGGETESLLFCLQAALGSGVLFFGFDSLADTVDRDDPLFQFHCICVNSGEGRPHL